MHPIERLRYVARAGHAPDRILVAEALPAFSAFASSPQMLLVAARQLIARHPESPGLLALGAHVVGALEPMVAGWDFSDALSADRTHDIAETVAVAESGGTDVIDSIASGRSSNGVEVLCPKGTQAWLDDCRQKGRSAVVVTPFGSRLPPMLWSSFLQRMGPESGSQTEVFSLDTFDDLIGSDGVSELSTWSTDCPDIAEVAR